MKKIKLDEEINNSNNNLPCLTNKMKKEMEEHVKIKGEERSKCSDVRSQEKCKKGEERDETKWRNGTRSIKRWKMIKKEVKES